MFSIIGTTYGGNGVTNFALPNLQATVAVGTDGIHPIGTTFGQQSTIVTTAQLPPGGAPVNNDQPSLAVEYLIAISGIFPSRTGGNNFNSTVPTLGEIVEFAGDFVPSAWALGDGQLLPTAQDQALFSIIGTTYGGNGVTNFALPDFDGRTAIGAGDGYNVGELVGTDQVTLTGNVSSNITPLPSTWTMLIPGLGGLGLLGWRRKRKSRVSLFGAA